MKVRVFLWFFLNFEQGKLIGIWSLTFGCKDNALVKGENGKFLCEDYKIKSLGSNYWTLYLPISLCNNEGTQHFPVIACCFPGFNLLMSFDVMPWTSVYTFLFCYCIFLLLKKWGWCLINELLKHECVVLVHLLCSKAISQFCKYVHESSHCS